MSLSSTRPEPPNPSQGSGLPETDGQESAVPKRVWSSTLLQVVGRFWGAGCTFITLALLARHLDGPEFGRFTFYIAVFMLLDALADFGTGPMAVQRTATRPGELRATLVTARRIRLIAGFAGFLLLGGSALLTSEPGAVWLAIAALYPMSHALELSTVPFKNRIDWRMPVTARLMANTLRMGLVLTLYFADVRTAAPYVLATALGSSTANFMIHFAARHELRSLPGKGLPAIPWRPFLAKAAPLGMAGLAQQGYFYIDNLFVRPIAGETELGYYNASVRLLSFAIMIAQYASLSAMPWFTREHEEARLGQAVSRLGQPLFFCAALGAGLVIPHSAAVLGLIFKPEFNAAGSSLAWLLGAMAVIYFGALHLTALVSTGHTKTVSAITLLALGINVVGNALLVPRLGIEGAAIATVATETVVAITAAIALARMGVLTLAVRPLRWAAAPAAFAIAFYLSSLAT
ncbi:MAG: oligosaccharide flippase family protein [Planctomycetota bacterium]|nr:oligosaccharide flippase family protein [Planctomycetota bacterium]